MIVGRGATGGDRRFMAWMPAYTAVPNLHSMISMHTRRYYTADRRKKNNIKSHPLVHNCVRSRTRQPVIIKKNKNCRNT
jgi:hypothetical protein